jgi:hypothetical protein
MLKSSQRKESASLVFRTEFLHIPEDRNLNTKPRELKYNAAVGVSVVQKGYDKPSGT